MSGLVAMMFPSLFPNTHLITGLGEDADGSLRVYLDARYLGRHTHVDDEGAKAEIRRQFPGMGHVFTDVPFEALCDCPEPTS